MSTTSSHHLRRTEGVRQDGLPAVQRAKPARLGFLGHDLYLYPHLSVSENLVLFARLYDEHAPALQRYLARRIGPETADDLVADLKAGLERALKAQPAPRLPRR